MALSRGNEAMALTLVKSQSTFGPSAPFGSSATSTSLFEEICIKLVEAGSEIAATDQVPAHHGGLSLCSHIIDEQAGDTLLSLAVRAGFGKVVTMLLQRGADVNWANAKVHFDLETQN